MCEAIEGIRNDGVMEGIQLGIQQGEQQGIQKGAMKILKGLVNDGLLTIAEAANRADMSVDEFRSKAFKN